MTVYKMKDNTSISREGAIKWVKEKVFDGDEEKFKMQPKEVIDELVRERMENNSPKTNAFDPIKELEDEIREGELTIRSGESPIGRKMTPQELAMVQRSKDIKY